MQEEHRAIRKSKQDEEPLNWEDYQQMEFTNNVNQLTSPGSKNNFFSTN